MKRKSGFTLIELMVVITILSILGAISYSIFSGARRNANDAKMVGDVNQIAKAYEAKYDPETETYKSLEPAKDFASQTLPQHPTGGTYELTWDQANSRYFRVCAKLNKYYTSTQIAYCTDTDTPVGCYCKVNSQGIAPNWASLSPPTPTPTITIINVYVLQDGTTECASRIKPFLDATGFITTTCGINEYSYSGTSSVDLSSYRVIILINGASYSSPMPDTGQLQLYTEVNTNGKGLIVFEWSALESYDNRWRILDRSGGSEISEAMTKVLDHPVTQNLPATWMRNQCGSNIGTGRGSVVVTGSSTNYAVVVGTLGIGKIVEFGIAPGYSFYNCWDANTQMLLKNAIRWVGS